MDIPELISQGQDLSEWIGSQLDGLKLKSDERSVLACSCFHIAIEHHRSITVLVSQNLNGSAFALVRLIYESLVRGIWLYHCATEQQIQEYKSDKLDLKFYQLLQAVESVPGWSNGLLRKTKESYWGAMNSFTHSGILQSSRRFNGTDIESTYEPEEIARVLRFSGAIALLTGTAIAGLIDDLPLATAMLERSKTFANRATP